MGVSDIAYLIYTVKHVCCEPVCLSICLVAYGYVCIFLNLYLFPFPLSPIINQHKFLLTSKPTSGIH